MHGKPARIQYSSDMNTTERRAMEIIESVKGAATTDEFDAKHAPVGPILATKLVSLGLLGLSNGRLYPTKEASGALASAAPDPG
jgi:hypothetical protein